MLQAPCKGRCGLFVLVCLTSLANAQVANQPAPADKGSVDKLIMLAVENELLASEAVKSHRIDVGVDGGIVILSGFVHNYLAEQIAVGLAQRVRGVTSVVDQLEVSGQRRDDTEVHKDVLAALTTDPDTRRLKLSADVQEGVVTLTGEVPSYGEKLLAANVASAVTGVTDLASEIQVEGRESLTDQEMKREISDLCRFSVELDTCQIEVEVRDHNVVLDGEVASDFQRSVADRLAWQVGAKSVDVRGLRVHWRHDLGILRAERYEKVTDDQVRAAIQRAFKYDPRLLSFDPQVQVEQGSVTLTGNVGHLAAKQAAERIARYTVGVRRIQNMLHVRGPEETPSDEQIAEFTREAMRRDPYIDAENVVVECENAHIGLYGLVDTQFEKYHAEWTASCQNGVVHIDNYLAVRNKWEPKSDAAIEADLKDKLAQTFVDDENQVTAKVVDGVALLEGTVDTWYMWQSAVDQAVAAGAREPHVQIEVRYGLPSAPQYYGPHEYIPR